MPKGIWVRRNNASSDIGELFWPRVNKTATCWLWTGSIRGNGYGQTVGGTSGKGRDYAHRVAYELVKGPIPAGLAIDHVCRVRLCVNPDHLEAVTPRTNLLRGLSGSAINARKTKCYRGHEFEKDRDKRGKRICRPCVKIKNQKAYAKAKAIRENQSEIYS